jgi:hypothetical protein
MFIGLDVFMQITPFGKMVYSRINPPDVVITTVPSGAAVTMKTKDGDVIVENANSDKPIALRKVDPQSYIVTAVKKGFQPVQRVVRIEEKTKSTKSEREKIEIMFDFMLEVNSDPSGADVYIDGNKFGVTPCKAQLIAGAHTVKLVLPGYIDLGSEAKEFKEGQCNVDFSKSNIDEMFTGVDKNYWDTELQDVNGGNIFTIFGHMYKPFSFSSEPENMTVHIDGESKPRGVTPITVNIKKGTYKVRLLDAEGRYTEAIEEFVVSSDSVDSLKINMKKNIVFKVKAKGSSEFFAAKLNIEGDGFVDTKDINTSKPITIPLPVGKYNFTFKADNFENYVRKDVDIEKTNTVNAEMIYSKVPINIAVSYVNKAGKTLHVPNAFIWVDNKIAGKTNAKGLWQSKVDRSIILNGKIVAQGFIDQQFKISAVSGSSNINKITLISSASDDSLSTNTTAIENIDYEQTGDSSVEQSVTKNTKKNKGKETQSRSTKTSLNVSDQSKKSAKSTKANSKEEDEVQVIVCPYCGYVNTVPAGKKLRFCINCARPLKVSL